MHYILVTGFARYDGIIWGGFSDRSHCDFYRKSPIPFSSAPSCSQESLPAAQDRKDVQEYYHNVIQALAKNL